MPEPPEPSIYQLRAVLFGVGPIIWRRLLNTRDYAALIDVGRDQKARSLFMRLPKL